MTCGIVSPVLGQSAGTTSLGEKTTYMMTLNAHMLRTISRDPMSPKCDLPAKCKGKLKEGDGG